MSNFKADIDDFVKASDKRMIAIMRQSIQDVIDSAQLPVAKGGRMRVDTGFLRASGQASLSGMPTGPVRGERKEKNAYDNGSGINPTVEARLGELKLGATFFFGWTANYARYRELYDGFLEAATQQWQQIVTRNTDTLRQRMK